jgi:hypothetical protein
MYQIDIQFSVRIREKRPTGYGKRTHYSEVTEGTERLAEVPAGVQAKDLIP